MGMCQTICILKDSETRYTFQGDGMTRLELFSWARKRPGRAKVLTSVMVTVSEDDKSNPVAAKIVFVRDRSKKSWLELLSTHTELVDEEIGCLWGRTKLSH